MGWSMGSYKVYQGHDQEVIVVKICAFQMTPSGSGYSVHVDQAENDLLDDVDIEVSQQYLKIG